MSKPKILIVTTTKDLSLNLFFMPESAEQVEPAIVSYESNTQELSDIFKNDFAYIYFRDPFNDRAISQNLAKKTVESILKQYQSAYKIDGVNSYEDMYFEDKWRQYKLFSSFMPPTELLKSLDRFDQKTQIIKKRISARSKDIIFSQEKFPANAKLEEYIVQSKLDVQVEYRVYMVGGKIIQPLALKSSKTVHQKTRVTGLENKTYPEITKICEAAYDTTHYDLMGLDIVRTKDEFVLLEVNRSCQFKAYLRESHLNLAALLNSYLLTTSRH